MLNRVMIPPDIRVPRPVYENEVFPTPLSVVE
jgi:hypothetical protein